MNANMTHVENTTESWANTSGQWSNMVNFASPWEYESVQNVSKNLTHGIIYRVPRLIVGYWELLVAICGTPANFVVLYFTISFLRSNFKYASTNYHQSNGWFVASMTIADAIFCSIHAPMMFFQYVVKIEYNAPACFFKYITTHTTGTASSLSLLLLNIDKFLYLNRPLHYHRCMTTKRALSAVTMIWVVSICWAFFFLLGPFSQYKPACDFRPSDLYWYMVFAVVFFVLPTSISLGISIYIASVVVRVSKENAMRKNSRRSISSALNQAPAKSNVNTKAILFVFSTTMWSSITYLPYRFAYLYYITPNFPKESWTATASFYFLFALMATNAAGNPFITVITQRKYTLAIRYLWHWIKAKARGEELRRKASSNAASTLMSFHSVASRMTSRRNTKQGRKLLGEPDRESAM